MNRPNLLERQKMISILLYISLAIVAVLLPLTYAHATSIGTTVSVTGTLTVTDISTFTGAATFNGNVTVGNLATADTLTITARLAADLDPNANNTIDLGAFDLAYNDVFVSGTLYAGTLSQWDTALSLGGNFTAGDATTTDKVYLNSRIASSMIPTVNDSEDVGEFSRAWNDVFASGTAYLAGFTSAASGAVTVGTSTANTLTVTARLAADLDPSTDNERDLGTFGLAYRDIYSSSTVFAADISDLLYVDAANSRIGISSSTPSAKLSIGTVNTTSTIDVPQLCFRTTVDVGGTDTEVYYWPCTGLSCPTVAMAAAGWATSTASCF